MNCDDKTCPDCGTVFTTNRAKKKHQEKKVCRKTDSPRRQTRHSRSRDPPFVFLQDDKENLVFGHPCFYAKYKVIFTKCSTWIIYLKGIEFANFWAWPMRRFSQSWLTAPYQEGSRLARPPTLTGHGWKFCWRPRTMALMRSQFRRKVNCS